MGGQLAKPGPQPLDRLRAQPVVHPAAALAVRQQPRLLEHPQMKRELRLRQAKRLGELAHAALPTGESLNHLQADRLGQGPEQSPGVVCRERLRISGHRQRGGENSTHVIGNTRFINPS